MEIDKEFKYQVERMRKDLLGSKDRYEAFESDCKGERLLSNFLEVEARVMEQTLNSQFSKIWEQVNIFDKDRFEVYQKYIQKKLYRVLVKGIEVNTHIAVKPYGYAGDFQMMNYIYDYCNQDKWLGSNAYEKVINRYSTNLSICQGNIFRKEFIKNEIKKEIQRKPNAKILSIGCGPAREITEMIDEGVLNNEAKYVFFDFEKQAIDFVKQLLKAKEHRIELKAEFVLSDIRDFILKGMPSTLNECDLIYISGVFDYLKDQTCQRVMHNIVKLLVPGGRAIICNMSDEYAEDRAYYELLGDWFMYHRTAKKMYELVPANIGKIASRVDFVPGTKKYHCLTLVKE